MPPFAGDEAARRRLHRPGQGYTRFVTVMKIALPMLAAGLVVLLAVWSQFNLQETRFTLGVTEVAPDQIESLNMVNARFDGIDEKNRPYSVTAELVTQAGESADTIELTGPKADITLESGAWIALTADSGAFSRKAEILADAAHWILTQSSRACTGNFFLDEEVLARAGRPETSDIPEVKQHVAWAPGPRASQALMLACRARAVVQGRLAPSVDDVIALAPPILRHRMALNFAARADGITIEHVIDKLCAPLR